jgi:hypothetical protein
MRTAALPPTPWLSIYNQAQTPDDLCVDDLSPKARLKAGRSASALFM